jgi:hypothetical protein
VGVFYEKEIEDPIQGNEEQGKKEINRGKMRVCCCWLLFDGGRTAEYIQTNNTINVHDSTSTER